MSSGNILKPWFTNSNGEQKVVIDANKRMVTRMAEYEEQKRQEKKRLEVQTGELEDSAVESFDGFVEGLFAEKIDAFTDEDGNLVYQSKETEPEDDISRLLQENPDYEMSKEAQDISLEGPMIVPGGMSAEVFQANWEELEKEKEYLEIAKTEYAKQEEEFLKNKSELENGLEQLQVQRQQLQEECEQEIAAAKEKADEILQTSKAEGYQQGYDEGRQKAFEELEEEKRKLQEQALRLEEEYAEKVKNLEPQFAECFMGLYRHIFQVDFSKYEKMVPNLIISTFQKIDSGKNFMIHVSKADYGRVNQYKKQIQEVVPNNATVEVVEDFTLKENECLIETENGIFDCGLDTQLEELEKEIRVLAYRRG